MVVLFLCNDFSLSALSLIFSISFAAGDVSLLFIIIGVVVSSAIALVTIFVTVTVFAACAKRRRKLRQISESLSSQSMIAAARYCLIHTQLHIRCLLP